TAYVWAARAAQGRALADPASGGEVPELVRVAGHEHGDDSAVFDLQRGGLDESTLLDRDESRQAVDDGVAHEPGRLLGEHARESRVEAQDVLQADDRLE